MNSLNSGDATSGKKATVIIKKNNECGICLKKDSSQQQGSDFGLQQDSVESLSKEGSLSSTDRAERIAEVAKRLAEIGDNLLYSDYTSLGLPLTWMINLLCQEPSGNLIRSKQTRMQLMALERGVVSLPSEAKRMVFAQQLALIGDALDQERGKNM